MGRSRMAPIRYKNDPGYIAPLMKTLDQRQEMFTSSGFGRGMETLARISSQEEDKEEVRTFLLRYIQHPKKSVQTRVIGALGILGDPKAEAVIETFFQYHADNSLELTAKSALEQLRKQKEFVPDEIVSLRKKLDEVQENYDQLQEDLDDLKKQFESGQERNEREEKEEISLD